MLKKQNRVFKRVLDFLWPLERAELEAVEMFSETV